MESGIVAWKMFYAIAKSVTHLEFEMRTHLACSRGKALAPAKVVDPATLCLTDIPLKKQMPAHADWMGEEEEFRQSREFPELLRATVKKGPLKLA